MKLSPPSLAPISSSLGLQVCSGLWGLTLQQQAGETSLKPQAQLASPWQLFLG